MGVSLHYFSTYFLLEYKFSQSQHVPDMSLCCKVEVKGLWLHRGQCEVIRSSRAGFCQILLFILHECRKLNIDEGLKQCVKPSWQPISSPSLHEQRQKYRHRLRHEAPPICECHVCAHLWAWDCQQFLSHPTHPTLPHHVAVGSHCILRDSQIRLPLGTVPPTAHTPPPHSPPKKSLAPRAPYNPE